MMFVILQPSVVLIEPWAVRLEDQSEPREESDGRDFDKYLKKK
jgi:hypothetical protein